MSKPLEPLGERETDLQGGGGGVPGTEGGKETKAERRERAKNRNKETEGQGGAGADRQTDMMMEDVGSGV